MAKTTYGADNVFNITDPHIYRCQLHHYHNRLSRLYLSVFKGASNTPAFFLLFSDVAYLDTPVNWNGANFHIGSKEACIDRLLEAGLIGEAVRQFPDAYAPLTEHVRLYTVRLPLHAVQIIAGSTALLQQIPDELK